MLLDVLKSIYTRDFQRLKKEIEQYQNEADIWKIGEGIKNSSGTLVLHLIGNLNAFIGAELGNSGYIRNREQEFSLRDISRKDLLTHIDETSEVILATLKNLSASDLEKEYPIQVFGKPMTTEYFLVHLGNHFNYHLGQMNYHRRLLGSS